MITQKELSFIRFQTEKAFVSNQRRMFRELIPPVSRPRENFDHTEILFDQRDRTKGVRLFIIHTPDRVLIPAEQYALNSTRESNESV